MIQVPFHRDFTLLHRQVLSQNIATRLLAYLVYRLNIVKAIIILELQLTGFSWLRRLLFDKWFDHSIISIIICV